MKAESPGRQDATSFILCSRAPLSWRPGVLAIHLILGLAACSHRPSLPKNALGVPLVRQATGYSCGAAALLAVLRYWRAYDGDERSLYAALDTTEADGTEPDAIERVARAHGLDARWRTGATVDELRAAAAVGSTVIVDLQAWRDRAAGDWASDWDDGHYVVMVALDDKYLYAMDPSVDAAYDFVALGELARRWHDEYRDHRRFEHGALFIAGRSHLAAASAPLVEMR